jgi:hypothetical protein
MIEIKYILCAMRTMDPQIQTLLHKNPSRVLAAEAIFNTYSLSPDDRDEAVARYLSIADDRSFEGQKTVETVLYSLDCENVWRRNFS